MIRALIRRLPSRSESRRSKASAGAERAEARLELACTWGAGHLLVTGSDRADARDLLERVLRRIDPLATVRARACNPNPESALDGVFALSEEGGPLPSGRRERRQALLQLVEKAQSVRRSIFVVVDDGDEATVEQLERLRASVEVTPEALERLRLVFLGGSALVEKLNDRAARALSSRITSRIRVSGAGAGSKGSSMAGEVPPVRPALAIAAGVSCALLAYGATRLVLSPQSLHSEAVVVAAAAPSLPTSAVAVAPVVRGRAGLRGDEPFLGQRLQIPIHPQWTTGSALFPPPPPAVASASVELPMAPPPAPTHKPTPPAPHGVSPVIAAAAPRPPVNVSSQLAAGSSIAALVARFR